MAVNQIFNGITYAIPTQGDLKWGPPLTRYLVALGSFSLSPTGGSFPLTADVNFGSSFGLLAPYYKSSSADIAATGQLRLANLDSVAWRNFTNSADLALAVNNSNQLTFNGVAIGPLTSLTNTHIFVGNISNAPVDVALSGDATLANTGAMTITNNAITNAKLASSAVTDVKVAAGAAIAVNKLAALTASKAVVTDGSGFLTPSATSATQIGYSSNVTSDIQAQINALTVIATPTGAIVMWGNVTPPSGWLICDGSAINRTTFSTLFAVIGTTFGVGDGSTTFNLPNTTNNVPVGAGSIASLGVTAGTQTVTPTSIAHTHTIAHQHSTTVSVAVGGATMIMDNTRPYGTDSISHNFSDVGSSAIAASAQAYDRTSDSLSANSGSTTVTMNASSVVQPSLGLLFIIKT